MKKQLGGLALLLLLASTVLAQVIPPRPPTFTAKKTYSLSTSTSPDLSGGVPLQGATLSGTRYIFTSLASSATTSKIPGVAEVCFWLDDVFIVCGRKTQHVPAAVFAFRQANNAEEDLDPGWDTKKISDGIHSLREEVMTADGVFETTSAIFKVSNTGKHVSRDLERPSPPEIMGLEQPGPKLVNVAFSPSNEKTTKDFIQDLNSNDPHFMAVITNPMTYNIWRSAGACGGTFNPTRIASGVSAQVYTDTTVSAGASYCYAITQVDMVTAQQSDYSNKVTAVVPTP